MAAVDASVLWPYAHPVHDLDDFHVPNLHDMTAAELDAVLTEGFEDWHFTSPVDQHLDVPKTPSRYGRQPSASPSSGHAQYTPGSTPSDWHNGAGSNQAEDGSCEDASTYTTSPIDGYEHISFYPSRSSEYSEVSRPPHTEQASSTRRSRDSSVAPSANFSHTQWNSFASSTIMDDHTSGQHDDPSHFPFNESAFVGTGLYTEGLLAGMNANQEHLPPFRPGQPQDPWPVDYSQPGYTAFTQAPLPSAASWGTVQSNALQQYPPPAMAMPTLNTTVPHAIAHQNMVAAYRLQHDPVTRPYPFGQQLQNMPTRQTVPQSMIPEHTLQSTYPQAVSQQQYSIPPVQQQRTMYAPAPATNQINDAMLRHGHRPIAVAGPSIVPARHTHDTKPIKGGRKRNSHLNDQARQKSSAMRKTGACWRCAMQRDTCDGGDPCNRCLMRWQKGQQYFFDCDRSKLPDFVLDFLPPSMTLMHQKQTIEDCVQEQVHAWDFHRPVDVYLTTGYGHALRWTLYEFKPKSRELLGQFQYLQDVTTRRSVRYQKYSPPLGITKLEPSDDSHFQHYLDELLQQEHLRDFPWTCFEEETQINDFQATTLALMCQLYERTKDYDLSELLRKIIRMMIITYIMGHTLTISEETLQSVVGYIRHTPKPERLERRTSPRLANRQLKFFFAAMRQQIYEDILKWQQATLHASGPKESTWLSSFCVMLGLAMVLEEVQRVIQIQADAKTQKGEKTNEEAQQEAANACERIDARYKLLVGLFQCKYRDKKWTGTGSFGNCTPTMRDPNEIEFLHELHGLLVEREQHLRSRRDVPFSSENQCQYTSRLVARFLLPFLGLPVN